MQSREGFSSNEVHISDYSKFWILLFKALAEGLNVLLSLASLSVYGPFNTVGHSSQNLLFSSSCYGIPSYEANSCHPPLPRYLMVHLHCVMLDTPSSLWTNTYLPQIKSYIHWMPADCQERLQTLCEQDLQIWNFSVCLNFATLKTVYTVKAWPNPLVLHLQAMTGL